MKGGFKGREGIGAITILIVILIAVGVKLIYDRAVDQREAESLQCTAEEVIAAEIAELAPAKLFKFDPNTVTLRELMLLGLEKNQAVSVIRYREAGKIFRIKEDLFTCYNIDDSLYFRLEPYIVIGEKFRFKKYAEEPQRKRSVPRRELLPLSTFNIDTVGVKYLMATGVLSRRQAEVFVEWRDRSGIYDMDELRECYVVSDSIASLLEPYIIFAPIKELKIELVDINKADSAELRSVYGIGEKGCAAILDYRKRLGGFYTVAQLSELKVMTESNYYKIIRQISCDSCDISKIDVNFAAAFDIKGHPYVTNKVLRKLLSIRGLKGGWSTIEEMIEDKIFTQEEANRVRPYLVFGEFEPIH